MNFLPLMLSVAVAASPCHHSARQDERPQSIIFDIASEHLSGDAREKRLLVIGLDGFCREALSVLDEHGAVWETARHGELIMTYAGGSADCLQRSDTVPGWCTILTGKLADDSGVRNNQSVKRDSAVTFLTAAARRGRSCAFISSYAPHFDRAFARDIKCSRGNGLDAAYVETENDRETADTAEKYLNDGCDAVFAILEYTDIAGHAYGFGSSCAEYRRACRAADNAAGRLISSACEADKGDGIDRLIIITTDHGGVGRRHGGQSADECDTFAAVAHYFSDEK